MTTDPQSAPLPESSALKANLLETAVAEVVINSAYEVIAEIVRDYKGICNNATGLLYEISHPFRNWRLILPKLRAFVLKNNLQYARHPQGPQAFAAFIDIFFEAIEAAIKALKTNPAGSPAAGVGRGNRGPKSGEDLLAISVEAMLAYVEKLVGSLAASDLHCYEAPLACCFTRLHNLDDHTLMYVVQGHHPIKKIAAQLLTLAGEQQCQFSLEPICQLLDRILTLNYGYWLSEEDPWPWFVAHGGGQEHEAQANQLFLAISHQTIAAQVAVLHDLITAAAGPQKLSRLLELPAHIDIVRIYKEAPTTLGGLAESDPETVSPLAENRKLLFLFRIMDTAGLFLIHEETLREINRSLIKLIHRQTFEEIESFLLTTLQLLQVNVRRYPHTSLQCIQVLGTEAFKRGSSRLVESFLWEAVRFGFQYANVNGIDEDWQPIANPTHLVNIRVWLNLIMQEPKWCSTLFSALIINLHLSGTCIKDTDLFQRDITALLNHPIEPIYNLVKQFAKLMPVFFNEIGAEGQLREVSTELDELHRRQDLVIHFLRKQSHVESSNLIVDFIRAIFQFWLVKNTEALADYLPDEVRYQVQPEGPFIDDLHLLMVRLFEQTSLKKIDDLLDWPEGQRESFLAAQTDLPETERRRFTLLVRMFTLLHQKYNLGYQDLRQQLELAVNSGFPELKELIADLEICDTFQCLTALLNHLEKLQQTILSSQVFEAKEDIYYKRHIAVDIPSVYGRYREKKFDALSLTFRLENLANLYLEKLPETVNLSFITGATFTRIIRSLKLFLRALKIDGISSRQLETYTSLLASSIELKRFSYTQYLDIFRGLSEGVKDVIYAYYTNIHQNNLAIVIPRIGPDNLLAKYQSLWDSADQTSTVHKLSESFLRDLIANTFGLQHLDNFITRTYQTLQRQKELLDKTNLDLLMTYNPDKVISFLGQKNAYSHNLILLGNKGYNLTLLAADHHPVPPGFIITTEIFRCWPVVKGFNKARDEFMSQLRQALTELEQTTGRRYGDPENPLLFSVRSGAAVSMPGMMATLHNVGLNPEIAEEYATATGNEYLVWDNYRRFLQSWAMAKGMEREIFQIIMNEAKARHNVQIKAEFTPLQMKELALSYQKVIRDIGIGIPEDPWLQLIGAVEMVLDSWHTEKTREYRSLMGVSESWGTAVIIQTMVFGNLGPESGSGVAFTAHPYRKVRRVALWGDYAPGDQGEDIVGGLVTTYPVSIEQAELDGRPKEFTLEVRFPAIYERLLRIARTLVYEKHWDPQEIEFTFESPRAEDLYLLQTRDMITIKKKENFDAFAESEALQAAMLGKGIGVAGSALSGRAVFSVENIKQLKQEAPGTPLILIRQDTVPEDITEISMADGLLTARGGQTSHASVVALRLEKTCVVGCQNLKVYESKECCEISGQTIRFGDAISIDGRKGLVLKGTHRVLKEMHILPL